MALAQQLLASGRGVNGSAFLVGGMSSSADPMFIPDRAYRHAENVLHRGGVPRTRPGYRQVFTLPAGKLQGATYFRPLDGPEYLVFAVAGLVYASAYPFAEYNAIANVEMYEHASTVYFATSMRSAERNEAGEIQAIEPRRTLIIQDGAYTRAAYWDGESSGHIDPTVVLNDDDSILRAGTPLGGPCAFSGDRLWVARGNKVFAGDIADPLSFVENEYAGEGGFFLFDDDVIALYDVPSITNPFLMVFTKRQTYILRSGIRTRSLWKSTENFKATAFPDIGCVSHRSVTSQNGLLWWMTQTGLTNLNAAQQAQVTSRLTPQDTQMAVSKANLAADLSGTAFGAFENFLLVSVPYGDKWNTHTWVMDQAVTEEADRPTWAGVWTGTRPVEWVSAKFAGVPRIFYVSKDYDGENRLWEAFTADTTDNGNPIQCFLETKTHIDFSPKATGLDRKKFVFAETSLCDVLGDVQVEVRYAGTRGKYKLLAQHNLVATPGSLNDVDDQEDTETHLPQSRVLRTPNAPRNPAATCSSCGTESDKSDWIDIGFSLLISWTGRAGLRSYRIFVDPEQENGEGEAAASETGPKVLVGAECE